MIKSIILIALPRFSRDAILHVPWKQTYEVAKYFHKNGIKTTIITADSKNDTIDGISIVNFKNKSLRSLDEKQKEFLYSLNPDLIYWFGTPYSGLYLNKIKLKVPIIVNISSIFSNFKEFRHLKINEIINGHLFQFLSSFFPINRFIGKKLNSTNISCIITANNAISDRLIEYGVEKKKIKISPLCFEAELPIPILKEKDKDILLCYAGPLQTIRGSELILDVINILNKKDKTFKLLFLLRSRNVEHEKKILDKMINDKKISHLVKVEAGILSREKMAKFLNNSDILVIPNKIVQNEPPLIILEAMYLGKLVITTRLSGIPEMVNGKALLTKADSSEIAKKIESISNEDVFRMGNEAKAYVSKLPNWEYLGKWTLKVLDEIIGEDYDRF